MAWRGKCTEKEDLVQAVLQARHGHVPHGSGGDSDAHPRVALMATTSIDLVKVKGLPGVTAPLGFFDPLELSETVSFDRVRTWREVELKHGRVAMLAALGFPLAEVFHPLFGGQVDAPSAFAFQQTPLQPFWPVVVAAIAVLEIPSVLSFKDQFLINGFWSLKDDHAAGDLGFDPLRLQPSDPQALDDLRAKELNNGRLAMLAIAGMVAQELVTHGPLFTPPWMSVAMLSVSGVKVRGLPGATAPLGFFDPLELSKDVSFDRVRTWREAELKHGRVAMLAAFGFPLAEVFHPLFGGQVDAPSAFAFQQTPLQPFYPWVVAAIAVLEIPSVLSFRDPSLPGSWWVLKEDHVSGDLGFDPMGLQPSDPQALQDLQAKELNNGRLAMLAIAGMVAQELVTNSHNSWHHHLFFAVTGEKDGVTSEKDGGTSEKDGVTSEKDGVTSENDGATAEKDITMSEEDGVTSEKDGATGEKDGATSEKHGVTSEKDGVKSEKDDVMTDAVLNHWHHHLYFAVTSEKDGASEAPVALELVTGDRISFMAVSGDKEEGAEPEPSEPASAAGYPSLEAPPPLPHPHRPLGYVSARELPGATAPLGFFDPLGLSEGVSFGRVRTWREAELKHGRVAMLAALGFPLAELFHPLFGGQVNVPSVVAFQETPLQDLWLLVVPALALLEAASARSFKDPSFPGNWWLIREDRAPGDLGFDPLRLMPSDPVQRERMQSMELNNGRLAMIAIAGMVAQELVTHESLFSMIFPATVLTRTYPPFLL